MLTPVPQKKYKAQQCTIVDRILLLRLSLFRFIFCLPAQVVVNLILCGIIAGLAAALSGALILPSVAGNELRESIARALVGVGKSLSGYDQPHHTVVPQLPFTHHGICISSDMLSTQVWGSAHLQTQCVWLALSVRSSRVCTLGR